MGRLLNDPVFIVKEHLGAELLDHFASKLEKEGEGAGGSSPAHCEEPPHQKLQGASIRPHVLKSPGTWDNGNRARAAKHFQA